jgi:hypothetical protein
MEKGTARVRAVNDMIARRNAITAPVCIWWRCSEAWQRMETHGSYEKSVFDCFTMRIHCR